MRRQSSSKVLILIHGSLSDTSCWDTFSARMASPELALHCAQIPIPTTMPGPEDQHLFGIEHASRLIAAELQIHAEHHPVYLLGHSRGGDIALLAAALCPQQLAGLILADPAPLVQLLPEAGDVSKLMLERRQVVDQALQLMQNNKPEDGLALFTDKMSLPGAWQRLPEAVRASRLANMWSLASLNDDCHATITPAQLRAITCPVHLITGEFSPPIYGAMHSTLANIFTNPQFGQIPGASHGMFRDNPDYFHETVSSFIGNDR